MKKLMLFIVLICCSTGLFAEVRVITIRECIDVALQNHPDYFISIEDQKKSIADYRIARSEKSVIINGEIRTIETDKDSTDTNSVKIPGRDTEIGLFAGLTMSYSIFDAKKDYAEDITKARIDMSKINSQKTKLDITFEVKSAYYGYLKAKNILIIREEIYNKNQKKTVLARQLYESGSRPILDVSKAEVDLADAQLQYEMAKNFERKMKMNLFHAMGLEETDEIDIRPEEIDNIPSVTVSLDELYKMMQIYSPVMRISVLEKRIAMINISMELASHYPEVGMQFGAGYELEKIYGAGKVNENFDGDKWSPTVYGLFVIKIPVYSGGLISARVDSAESDYYKVNYKEKETLIETKNSLRDSFRSLEEMKKQMDISVLVIKNAERHLLLAQKSYDNGGGSPLELQDAELSAINARIGYLESKYNYLITLAKLVNIIGIGEETICRDSVKKQSE